MNAHRTAYLARCAASDARVEPFPHVTTLAQRAANAAWSVQGHIDRGGSVSWRRTALHGYASVVRADVVGSMVWFTFQDGDIRLCRPFPDPGCDYELRFGPPVTRDGVVEAEMLDAVEVGP